MIFGLLEMAFGIFVVFNTLNSMSAERRLKLLSLGSAVYLLFER